MKTKNTTNQIFRILFVIAAALFTTAQVSAQNVKKAFSYEITLQGSSNIHEWTMKSSGSGLEALFNLDPSTKLVEGIQPLTFNMPVKNLKSNEGLLNSRAYDALKADKNPNITFKLVSVTAQGAQLNLAGQLTISGVTKDIALAATTRKNADGSSVISGVKKIKMSDWGINPPKYMLGVMRVYDDLTINYTIHL